LNRRVVKKKKKNWKRRVEIIMNKLEGAGDE
jgi:hypothetical protein